MSSLLFKLLLHPLMQVEIQGDIREIYGRYTGDIVV
jgi:hypothetical protein